MLEPPAQGDQPPDCRLAVGVGANNLGPVADRRRFGFGLPSALEPQSVHALARAIRWSAADAGLGRTYAEELIGLMPDVVLVESTVNLTAIRQATSTVPVVFVEVADPVARACGESSSQRHQPRGGHLEFRRDLLARGVPAVRHQQ
jgi:hypothetical protein